MSDLILEDIPPELRQLAVAGLDAGNVVGFLCRAAGGNQFWLRIVSDNLAALQERGLYERALLAAWSSCRVNHSAWPTDHLTFLFKRADRQRLRESGAPLPGSGPFTLYRGVSGRGRGRRVRGFSWTDDIEMAGWFALRYPLTLDPAVYRTVIQRDEVLAFLSERAEREFLILPPSRVTRLAGPIQTRQRTET